MSASPGDGVVRFGMAVVLGLATIGTAHAFDNQQAIRPWPRNPSYWQYHGKPLFLAGGSDDDNLFQWPRAKLIPQLDLLARCGGNYLRNTMSDRRDKGFELYPFAQRSDGKYDLEHWNPAYWERFDTFLRETERRGIIVQIEVWDRFDYARDNWPPHPYNPKNNVNYTKKESGLADAYPDHPGANKQPFFYTVPTLRNNETLLRYERRFVDKLLASSLRHGNVLYCMDNETSGAAEWGAWWAGYIKRQARRAGRDVYVTEMWDNWDLKSAQHRRTLDHPETYDFVDVSQNNHQKGQAHWDNFQWVRRHLADRPRPINTVKTYGADTGRYGRTQDGLERVWRHALGGAAAVRFHRPDSGLGLSAPAQATFRALRLVEGVVPFWDLRPANERLDDRAPNEAYAAVAADRAAVVFFPNGGQVTFDLRDRSGEWQVRWVDIRHARAGEAAPVQAGRRVTLQPPGKGLWLALLRTRSINSR